MAKYSRGSRKKYRNAQINVGTAQGALLDKDVVSGDLFGGNTVDSTTYLISLEGLWGVSGHTPGEGPFAIGVAHSDYTDSEIEEYLEQSQSVNQGDMIAQEIAKRRIRRVGIFNGALEDETLNDGRVLKTRLNFQIEDGKSLSIWTYNNSGAVFTAGSILTFQGQIHMRSA